MRIAASLARVDRETVEALGVALHLGGAIARRVDAERPELPDRLADDVALDVLAANERDMLAEFRDEQVDQPAAVLVLLGRHFDEHLGGGGIVLAQALGEVGVDAPVLLLVGDRQGEHFALGKIVEIAHRRGPWRRTEGSTPRRRAAEPAWRSLSRDQSAARVNRRLL